MSALAKQLEKLSNRTVSKKEKASLVFSGKEAADIDAETIRIMAINAFQKLSDKNPRFLQFSFVTESIDRMLMTDAENTNLSRRIDLFLLNLSPYCLSQEAQHPLQKSLSLLPRASIVRQVKNIPSLLNFVTASYCSNIEHEIYSKTWASFYTSLMLEFIADLPEIDNNFMINFLPIATKYLSSADIDVRASFQMIVSLLANRTIFSDTALSKVIVESSKNLSTENIQMTCLFLLCMYQLQPSSHFPSEAALNLLAISTLKSVIVKMVSEFESQRFIQVFVTQVITDLCSQNDGSILALLQPILIEPSLNTNVMKDVILHCFQELSKMDPENCQFMVRLLQRLHIKYFELIDDILNANYAVKSSKTGMEAQ